MFDIGLGEIIALAVIALIVFGPDRLPKAAAQGGKALRQLREMATNARKELGDSAGLDTISEELRSLQELHPKRIIASALEAPANGQEAKPSKAAPGSASGPASGAAVPPGPPAAADATSAPNGTPREGATPGSPSTQATPTPAPKASPGYDPDAT